MNKYLQNFKRIIASSSLSLTACMITAQSNIAINRAAYQSAAIDYNQTAHLATDGHLSTYWEAPAKDNQWLYVDLGVKAQIKELKIIWGDTFATDYSIEISSTGPAIKPTNWVEIKKTTSGKGGQDIVAIKTNQARYVKINILKSYTNKGCVIKEFEVIGKMGLSICPNLSLHYCQMDS
jgi:hypothetical protein